jgi:hypothetical protein
MDKSPPWIRRESALTITASYEANGSSVYSAISADGRFVAFASDASNLVPGDTNASFDVFVRRR